MNGQAEGEATDHSTAPIRSGRPHGSCGISVLRGYFDCRRSVLAARPTGTAWRIARTKGQSSAGLDHDRICTGVHCGGGFFQRHHSNRRHRPDGAAHRGRRPTGCVRRAHAMAAPLRMVLDADRRTPHARRRIVVRFAQGNLGAFSLGTALGLVWTPCAGPVLGSILTLIATRDSLVSGAVLLSVYAVGAAVPLLAIGWGGHAVTTRVRVFARHSRRLQQGFGAVMIAFAVARPAVRTGRKCWRSRASPLHKLPTEAVLTSLLWSWIGQHAESL